MRLKGMALGLSLMALATPSLFADRGKMVPVPRGSNQVGVEERMEKRTEGIEERTIHARNTTAPNNIVGLRHRMMSRHGRALGHRIHKHHKMNR
jgi:hypothetical protein